VTSDLARRRSLLYAALGAVRVKQDEPELAMVHRWLDSCVLPQMKVEHRTGGGRSHPPVREQATPVCSTDPGVALDVRSWDEVQRSTPFSSTPPIYQ
jgi:hypothetical protein